ncbi:hypothetical protein SS50377_20692 [Spironucleus salmonicida]|uniref:Transmembrane protein n=1 Tax=Spironucleus salmonicida TaxID=348837 RepID=V6M0H1_9EUKA|nr:hypothetical protein SS50377_20692 [Spironucleus salmonicida]|eukprot:EST49541.1 hypothetical protein SS50377_10145 [Spironucleus salmonicida]
MQLVVATLTTEFIYTKYQTNLTNCYSTQTTILYNRNINRIVVTLASENNTQCAVFPQGVEAQLAFQTSGIPIQRIQVANFSYANTTELVFEGVPDIASEEFVVLNVYSYGYITERSIFIFQEQKSSLTQCFETSSTVNIHVDKLIVTMNSTKLCTNQFDTITDGGTPPVVIGELTYASLNIEGSIFGLNVKTFQDEYKDGNTLTLEVSLTIQQSEHLLLLVAPTATITFASFQGGTDVDFEHDVGIVTTTGLTVGSESFWDINQNPQIGLFQSLYMLKFNFNPQISILEPEINKIKFDNIMFRLTGISPNVTKTQQLTIHGAKFDPNLRFMNFSCDEGRKLERDACEKFYNIAADINIVTTIYIDIIFQLGSKYVHIEKQVAEIQNKEILQATLSIGNDDATIQIYSLKKYNIAPNSLLKINITILQNSNPLPFSDPSLQLEISQQVDSLQEDIVFDCDKRCHNLLEIIQSQSYVYYQLDINLLPGLIFGTFLYLDDVRVMQGIIIGFSLIIIVFLIVTSIIQIIKLLKSIKQQKRRKAKKL